MRTTSIPPDLQIYADQFDKLLEDLLAKAPEKSECGDMDEQNG